MIFAVNGLQWILMAAAILNNENGEIGMRTKNKPSLMLVLMLAVILLVLSGCTAKWTA